MRRPIAHAAQPASSKSGVFPRASIADDATFASDLRAARAQVDALRARLAEGHLIVHEDDHALASLQEVDFAHEELRVVEEELHARADEILATRASLDFERRRYRELFELAPEAYVVTDLHGNVLEANRKAGVLLNVDEKLLAGKPLVTFVALSDRGRFRDLIDRTDDATLRCVLRVQPRRSDPIAVTISARRDTHGPAEGAGIRWLLRPNAGLLKAAQRRALRTRMAELERASSELKAALERSEVEKAALAARLAHKDHALSEVAHELGIPLGSIAGWLRILAQDKLPSELRKRGLMSMTRGVRALATMVEELSDHAQLEEDAVTLEREPLNLVRVVMETIEDLRPVAQLKATSFEIVAAQALPIEGDLVTLQKVFRNLIGTVINASLEHGTIHVATLARGDYAEVVLGDAAVMLEAPLDALLEPFSPAGLAFRDPSHGLGLGLSIAQRLVALHGGTLEASSDGPGLGSRFRVRLPLATPR